MDRETQVTRKANGVRSPREAGRTTHWGKSRVGGSGVPWMMSLKGSPGFKRVQRDSKGLSGQKAELSPFPKAHPFPRRKL